MLRRPFMGNAFKLRHGTRVVNWNRLIFRYRDEKKKSALVSLQSKWGEIQQLWSALPAKVDPINWAYWRRVIRTPGVVDEFQRKYDEEMKKEISVSQPDIAKRTKEHQGELEAAEVLAKKADENISELEKEISVVEWEKENVDNLDLNWTFKKFPGLQEQQIEEFANSMWFPAPELEKLETIDWKEMRRQMNNGNVRALAALSFMNYPATTSFGPYKDIRMAPSDELIKNYQSSPIWIAHQIQLQDQK